MNTNNLGYIWAENIGSNSEDKAQDFFISDRGFIYTTGYFQNNINFNNPFIKNLTSLGRADIFITAQEKNGNFVWAKSFGGSGFDAPNSLTVDRSGNIYLTGYFRNTATFNPGTNNNLTSAGDNDIFITKLNSIGNLSWAHSIGGSGDDKAYQIITDNEGNIYVTGYFSGTVDFDPSPQVQNLTSFNNTFDIFVAKYNPNGDLLWTKQLGGNDFDVAHSIALDSSNNIYLTGYFRSTADFDPSSDTFNLTSFGENDAFVAKLNTSGNLTWAKQLGGQGLDLANNIAIDSQDRIALVGYFSQTADFDPNAGQKNFTSVANSLDIFITQLSKNGDLIWATNLGSKEADEALAITVDRNDHIYTTGYFSDTITLNPNSLLSVVNSAGLSDIFIAKLNSTGEIMFAQNFGGTGADVGTDISLDQEGNLYTIGSFSSKIDFDPSKETKELQSQGNTDAFIAKFGEPEIELVYQGQVIAANGDDTLALGITQEARPISANLRIKNLGSFPLEVSDFTLPLGFSFIGPPPTKIDSRNEANLAIAIEAKAPQSLQGVLEFLTTDSDEPKFTVPIAAKVESKPEPEDTMTGNNSGGEITPTPTNTPTPIFTPTNTPTPIDIPTPIFTPTPIPIILVDPVCLCDNLPIITLDIDNLIPNKISLNISGTATDDTLVGGEKWEGISGLTGNDSLIGFGGNDNLDGGTGNDILLGSEGNDFHQGDSGNDSIYGGKDQDILLGNTGDDLLLGNLGLDSIEAGEGDDTIFGGKENDRLLGNAGQDTIEGDLDDDSINGDSGNDSLLGNHGLDYLLGGLGNDTIDGGGNDDTICGGDENDLLIGSFGADILDGCDGNDTLNGGSDNDTLSSGLGNDLFIISGDRSNDLILDFRQGEDLIGLSAGLTFAELTLEPGQIIENKFVTTNIITQGAVIATIRGIRSIDLKETDFMILADTANS